MAWIVAGGGYAKRDVFYLMGSEHSTFRRDDNDIPAFGVRFPYDSESSSIRWLDDGECELLWEKILNGYEGAYPIDVADLRLYGYFYAYAKWADMLGMKTLFRPLQPLMEVHYGPAKSLLYISQDCEELFWDCSRGLVVSNVPPELLGLDVEYVVRNLEKNNVNKKKYEPLLKMISDKKNESGGENNE